MQITYWGHSSFRIKTKTATIVCDPYSPKVGFKMPKKVEADIVTVSHDLPDHNFLDVVGGDAFVISGPGEYEIKEVSILGLPSGQSDKQEKKENSNIIFTFSSEDFVACHLGDLSHLLTSKMIEEIGTVDVLFVPVGGEETIGPKRAIEVVAQIEPHVVIPMHFKTSRHNPSLFAKLQPVDEFLKQIGVEYRTEEKLILTKGGSGEEMEVVVLKERNG